MSIQKNAVSEKKCVPISYVDRAEFMKTILY